MFNAMALGLLLTIMGGGILIGQLSRSRVSEVDVDPTEEDTAEIKRILAGLPREETMVLKVGDETFRPSLFGEVYVAPSPLLKFRDPLTVALNTRTAELPVIMEPEPPQTGRLGWRGILYLSWLVFRIPKDSPVRPYRGRHRRDGYTPRQVAHLNTSTMLLPVLESLKPNGTTMVMPWLTHEKVFA